MCNNAIRIAIDTKPANRFKLIETAYPQLREYGLHTHYVLSACEVAYSVFKNKRRGLVPKVTKGFLKLDNQSYRLNHLLLRIPTTPRRFIFLTLDISEYHLSLLEDSSLKRGSVTITDRSVIIAFSKESKLFEPNGFIGVDVNERNSTVSATNGYSNRFEQMGEVVEIKELYREIRAKLSKATRGDRRISKKLLAKYGKREKNRTTRRLHVVTKQIVNFAKEKKFGIKMEKLTGIRKRYRRGTGKSRSLRTRLNTWVFGEIQRQINYKARWAGVPVWYVSPRGTSRNCPDCGSRVAPLAERKLYCPECDKVWDRDDLASKNIMACAVPQARPSKGSGEGERGDDGSNPLSRWREVRLGGNEP
jgi:putative transposase